MTIIMTGSRRKRSVAAAAPLLAILVIWLSMAILVNPIGDFPLNDDWSFGRAVLTLVREGRFSPTGWTAMPLLTHALWGWLFCLPLGFSFTALRISTLVMGLIGVLATYAILKETRGDIQIPLLGALVVAVNPFYFSLSNTFMTDVTFCGVSLLSLFFLVRGLSRGRSFELAVGHVLACCAALNRQLGIAIPLAFAAAYLIKNGFSIRNLLWAVLPFLLVLGVLGLYQSWLESTVGLPARYNRSTSGFFYSLKHIQQAMKTAIGLVEVALMYLGLFLLPFLIPFAILLWRSSGRRGKAGMVLGFLAFSLWFGIRLIVPPSRLMPLSYNVFYDVGLGPTLLRDVEILGLAHRVRAPRWVWVAVTALSITGAGLLLGLLCAVGVRFVQRSRSHKRISCRWPTVLTASCGLLYFFPMAVSGYFLDRYLLFLVPLLVITVASGLNNAHSVPLHRHWFEHVIVYALVAVYAVFSLAATHDYLSWNRARWRALDFLTEELHVSPDEIDGGFEFNGWHGYDADYKREPTKSWWWVQRDDYIVSFGPIDGYKVIKRYTYPRWIPPGDGRIVVLRKLE